ncbi:PA26 p53-induced protein (sestrin) [compost metagenome]
MLNRFYNGYADLLDQEFDFIRNMTENNFYKAQNVDTTAFRNAIWVYVQRLYGVLEDDYDYKGVNMLLNIGLKKYIKTVVCYPERTEREQFVDMGFQFKSREKIHVNLLAMEARKQVALVYALQQIENQYSH